MANDLDHRLRVPFDRASGLERYTGQMGPFDLVALADLLGFHGAAGATGASPAAATVQGAGIPEGMKR